jgi:putative aldouronate transport system permease protein
MEAQFERMAYGQDLLLKNLNMEGLYSAIIIISVIPIICIYPILQKHFNKGLMVGSLKG